MLKCLFYEDKFLNFYFIQKYIQLEEIRYALQKFYICLHNKNLQLNTSQTIQQRLLKFLSRVVN